MNMGMRSIDSNDPSQWVMETSDSESTSSTDEYSFIGDMAFLKASPADGDIQNSMLTNVNRWVFRMVNRYIEGILKCFVKIDRIFLFLSIPDKATLSSLNYYKFLGY